MAEKLPETGEKKFDLTIPCDLQYVGSARRFLLNVLRMCEVAEDTRDSVGLVLTELVNNTIEHGSDSHKSPVAIHIELTSSRLSLEVTGSQSSPIDARRLQEAFTQSRLDDDRYGERGRGLFLVNTIMDEVKVIPHAGNGIAIQTVKYLKPAARRAR